MEAVERELAMHVAELESIFLKNPGRFMTTRDIADIMQKAEWTKYELFKAALETMVQRGQLEFDSTLGYCKRGQKDTLRQEMAKPSISRANFDKLSYAEQSAHLKAGGRVVDALFGL